MTPTASLPALLALALAHAAPAAAQTPARDTLPRGRVVEHVRAESDSAWSYALYLPSSWTAEKSWPVLILLDPGGRATVPVERFRAAAERRGWVVMSSYDTRNGDSTAIARDYAAVQARLND